MRLRSGWFGFSTQVGSKVRFRPKADIRLTGALQSTEGWAPAQLRVAGAITTLVTPVVEIPPVTAITIHDDALLIDRQHLT